ncbi:hypothetical protein D5H78_16010 [Vallicoccus soli]|uniref:DUF5872 domain-containing protein n=1 Tax=Vallicoccus soli TaxID=2339232 RepID=A0A3A3ZFH3_9ACTN|nr:hypothetical protein D5H78_16010 [Vallicoccus soli]
MRERLKAEITAGGKGGRAGQWSARKAQLLVQRYEAAGGGYTGPPRESQRHLEQWGDEHWRTEDDAERARTDDGGTKRYLPDAAWEELSPEQRESTERAKQEGTREGHQHVANPPAARRAARRARHDSAPWEGYDEQTVAQVRQALADLDQRALTHVRDYEQAHKARSTLLTAVDRRLG